MWKKITPLLILLSVALNLAFVGIWTAHAISAPMRGRTHEKGIWCPLHRKLGATEAQWREIEPRLIEFQRSARAVCNEVNRVRGEVIDLVAMPSPDMDAIRAKQEEILAGQRRMQRLVIEHLLAEKKLLDENQQRRLFDMLRSRSACAGRIPMMGPGKRAPTLGAETGHESKENH